MATWETYFPGWQIMKWDETNIPLGIPYLDYALQQKMYAFAADYVRMYALFTYGGVYLDTDVEVIRDFDSLLNLNVFAASEHHSGTYINGAVIGGQIQADFFGEILKYYDGLKPIIFKTLPNVMMDIYGKKPDLLTVLPSVSFYPYNPYEESQTVKQLMYCDITSDTYAIHHWYGTWSFSRWQKLVMSIKKRVF